MIIAMKPMDRREFLGLAAVTGTGAMTAGGFPFAAGDRAPIHAAAELKLLPFPQQISPAAGSLPLGQFHCAAAAPSSTVALAVASLNQFAPKTARTIPVRLGSVEEHYDRAWLTEEENHFLNLLETSPEASVVRIAPDGITVVGKSRWGMLYGAQTINQLIYQLNYDDDYDWTDGLCAKVSEELQTQCGQFLTALGSKPALDDPVPEALRASAKAPVLFIPWEKQTEIMPRGNQPPSLYLSTDLALTTDDDFFRLGVVYSVQAQTENGDWKTIFRHTLHRRDQGWQHWEIPLADRAPATALRLRFITDSYSRAQDRAAPTWKWALWGEPRLIRISTGGRRKILRDLCESMGRARCFVKLDDQRQPRRFDKPGDDSTGATFRLVSDVERGQVPSPFKPAIAAFTPHRGGKAGITIAQFDLY